METRRRQQVLGALAIVLAGLFVYRLWPRPSAAAPATSKERAAATDSARAASPAPDAPDVKLEALELDRPKPGDGERNLFRFNAKAPIARPTATKPAPGAAAAGPAPAGPPAPAPPPPITFKFIGIVEAPERSQKLAVLSDGRNVFHGREGDIIEGRYRILRIGAESVEMAYLDGRGRQTIRLTGS